jgi:hypothetical protein
MRQPFLILAFIALVLGCESTPTEPLPTTDLIRDETAPIQTGSLLYLLDQTETPGSYGIVRGLKTIIDYSYTNPTEATIYIVKCQSVSFALERRGDTGKWVKIWAGRDYARCLGQPTIVGSGATLTGALQVSGYEPDSKALPRFPMSDISGVFRMVLLGAVYLEDPSDYPDGVAVEFEYLYSNEFELRVH